MQYPNLLPILVSISLLAGLTGCSHPQFHAQPQTTSMPTDTTMQIQTERFGTTPDGREVTRFTLRNRQGMRVDIIDYGAIVTAIETPDKEGKLGDVVLGFDNLEGYIPNDPHIGGIVGRFANRIANGTFTLDGQPYRLAQNDPPHHLHGGSTGFDRVLWTAQPLPGQQAVKLRYQSPDMEEGYPGNLTATVVYTLTEDNSLRIELSATTDKATPVNLTNHSYFNLSAGQVNHIRNHVVQIHAGRYTPVDETFIPTGIIASVQGTSLDLTRPRAIGEFIHQLPGGGYDHNYVLQGPAGEMKQAATVFEPTSGRLLEVFTTQPGIQFYTGNFLDGTLAGKQGARYTRHYGFCLETQHFPDSPNQEDFPSTILRPGQTYRQTTVYKFSARKAAP